MRVEFGRVEFDISVSEFLEKARKGEGGIRQETEENAKRALLNLTRLLQKVGGQRGGVSPFWVDVKQEPEPSGLEEGSPQVREQKVKIGFSTGRIREVKIFSLFDRDEGTWIMGVGVDGKDQGVFLLEGNEWREEESESRIPEEEVKLAATINKYFSPERMGELKEVTESLRQLIATAARLESLADSLAQLVDSA